MRHTFGNGFQILTNRCRAFRRPAILKPEKVRTVTLAAITLEKIYIPKFLIDHENVETDEIFEGSWREDNVVEITLLIMLEN